MSILGTGIIHFIDDAFYIYHAHPLLTITGMQHTYCHASIFTPEVDIRHDFVYNSYDFLI